MKKIIYSIFAVLSLTSLQSCKDVLIETPESQYSLSNFFISVDNANRSILGILDAFSRTHHYGHNEMAAQACDDIYYIRDGATTDNSVRDIAHYKFTTSNQTVEQLWKWKYVVIDRANFAIAGIQQMSQYKEGNEKLHQYEAEARFLRALCAFDLVKDWGDVPIKTNYTEVIGDAYGQRVDRESIYNQIVIDLDWAINNLPWATTSSSPERVTKGAAHGLMMRILLTRSGYRLNMDGTYTRPDDVKRTEYLQKALQSWEAFKTIGYHSFYTTGYAQLFKDYGALKLDSKESLFEIAFHYLSMGGYGEDVGYWGVFNGPQVDVKSTLGRANSFFRLIPDWAGFYADGDVRKDVNICTYRIDANTAKVNVSAADYSPGKWRREWQTGTFPEINSSNFNFVYLRYSDVVLMASEIYNELGDVANAVLLLNQVRERAGITKIESDLSNYTTYYKAPKVWDLAFIDDSTPQGKIRTALYWERGFELCYELVRKNDLKRWGVLYEAIQLAASKTSNTTTKANYFAAKNFVKGTHELLCVPLSEIQTNKALNATNNPGY